MRGEGKSWRAPVPLPWHPSWLRGRAPGIFKALPLLASAAGVGVGTTQAARCTPRAACGRSHPPSSAAAAARDLPSDLDTDRAAPFRMALVQSLRVLSASLFFFK